MLFVRGDGVVLVAPPRQGGLNPDPLPGPRKRCDSWGLLLSGLARIQTMFCSSQESSTRYGQRGPIPISLYLGNYQIDFAVMDVISGDEIFHWFPFS
ncbi:hypothetical protein FQN60_009704 [Etheostoma spectabile]|uniref:Uncharacterized protein n=1 Tax=Etheostoma spectabile TaxID=54343 RepID=A0A5J5DJZ7_9PERO|nr:hypothetical protein FQN60_009704 [Etheostoma spectabile]